MQKTIQTRLSWRNNIFNESRGKHFKHSESAQQYVHCVTRKRFQTTLSQRIYMFTVLRGKCQISLSQRINMFLNNAETVSNYTEAQQNVH
jgi:hypothetical protein